MENMTRKKGYCGIGIYNPRHDCNIGTLFRSAYCLGADFTFTVGRPYKKQASDTVDSARHLPYFHFPSKEDFIKNIPKGARPVIVEIDPKAVPLGRFIHPPQAVYILGNEGGGLPKDWLTKFLIVQIVSRVCLNVSVAGSIVLADRMQKVGGS